MTSSMNAHESVNLTGDLSSSSSDRADTSSPSPIITPFASDCSICIASRRNSHTSDTGGLASSSSTLPGGHHTFYFAATSDDASDEESGDESPATARSPLLPKSKKGRASKVKKNARYSSISSSSTELEAGASCTKEPTPLPVKQISVLLLAQLPEPVVATVILPFINQLIFDLGITGGDDKKIGYYAGIVESMFFFCEFCCILHWGRLSDRIGRKPVILCGLAGLTLSIASFGMSKTYLTIIISRALAGLLSGNIGVFKSTMGEITDESNIAEGFALMPVIWSAGSTLGPALGGFLSHPQQKWPEVYSGEFWNTYPYLLPCLAAAFVCVASWVMVWLFLEESLPSLSPKNKVFDDKEYNPVGESLVRPISHIRSTSEETLVNIPPSPPPLRSILTRKVIIAVANYCSLSLLDIAYTALIPLFYATPIYAGGLGLSPANIGTYLASLGIINGFMQWMFTAKAQRRFGLKFVFMTGVCCYFGIFAIFPMLNAVARSSPDELPTTIYVLMFLQLCLTICVNTSFGCCFLFINAAAERSSLGATNGIAQTSVSLIRTVGPTAASCLFALSVEQNLLGGRLVYWVLMALTVGALGVGTYLPSRTL